MESTTNRNADHRPDGQPRREASAVSPEHETLHLIDETLRLYFRLRHVADQIHRNGPHSGGRRSVLRTLRENGPSTVPDMARSRPVSRQTVQTVVNGLLDDGLVEREINPAHKRSFLIRLTDRGRDVLDQMNRRELRLMERLDVALPPEEVRRAARVLRTLREAFEGTRWEELIALSDADD